MPDEERDPAGRDDADDYDLLTYGEVWVRLREEIEQERMRLVGGDEEHASASRRRVAALEEAVRRYRRHRLDDQTFEQFFGFRSRRSPGRDGARFP